MSGENIELKLATEAAFAELKRQLPNALDCSAVGDYSQVVPFDGFDLTAVVRAALRAAKKGG